VRLFKSLTTAEKVKIRKKVETAFEKYRIYCSSFEEVEANITTSYEQRYHGPTNKTSDQTASAAIYNVEEQRKRNTFCRRVEQAVTRLPEIEKFLITERYMSVDSDYISDMTVYCFKFNPPISHPTYGKIKDRAMYKIALCLGLWSEEPCLEKERELTH
jgi:ArpU family phage transcriptional regulator